MGKRRIRCLNSIGNFEIVGLDPRLDRRIEASKLYGIETYENLEQTLLSFKPNVFVISTPPDLHMHYAFEATHLGADSFIEASVVDADKFGDLSRKCKSMGLISLPSCTMKYFPGPRKIKELIGLGIVGEILAINYHVGQYLGDWHAFEPISEYYVSKRCTGGARELVPFELTWLNDIFGQPEIVNSFKTKLSDLEADIDDIYQFTLLYKQKIVANLIIEVISRPVATREMRIIGSNGIIVFSGERNLVCSIKSKNHAWDKFYLPILTAEPGYINPETPYIEEMKDFLSAIRLRDVTLFPNSLENDFKVLQNLSRIEQLSNE